MKNILLFCFLFVGTLNLNAQVEEVILEGPTKAVERKFETFEMTEGDTTYVMKKYFIAFLKTGPNREHSVEEAADIQKGHLAHMDKLAKENKICIAGPFDDDGEIRGVVVYSVYNMEEALFLTSMDPAVKAGRLIVEVHPWWAAKGSSLF